MSDFSDDARGEWGEAMAEGLIPMTQPNQSKPNPGNQMTNHNERLDDVVSLIGVPLPIEQAIHAKNTAKQALTSLIKELVAEAKPEYKRPEDAPVRSDMFEWMGYNKAINEFEQNLLKALEEV